jgi:NAD(P)-dependent dehydrogenase (short-subunit alcohol dehydrogenase family)
MEPQTVLVVGATGDVGRGVVAAAAERGWSVTAAARSEAGLAELREQWPELTTVRADVATADGAGSLAQAGGDALWTAVVVAVNSSGKPAPLVGQPYPDVAAYLAGNLAPHLNCISAFLPALPAGAVLLGIGGGMADFVVPGMAAASMTQAAQRMAYRYAAKEAREHGVVVRELLVRSMVAGASNRETAAPEWLTDRQVGDRACEIIADPGEMRDPVIVLDP